MDAQGSAKILRAGFALYAAAMVMMCGAMADVSLGSVFGDYMVLQREEPISVWGDSAPEESITVSLNGATAKTRADLEGAWTVKLPAMKAGGPYELTVQGAGESLVLNDVLVGDVWICSGQSNMGMTMRGVGRGILDGEKEIAAANYPNLRLFVVTPTIGVSPQDELSHPLPWAPCTPESVLDFSAVAYFFGRHVHEKERVPVGLVMTAWGGTIAEAWTSKAGLATLPEFGDRLKEAETNLPRLDQIEAEYQTQSEAWESQMDSLDAGIKNGVPAWSKPETSTTDWKPIDMPLPISVLIGAVPSGLGGRVWLRRDVDLPVSWQGCDLQLTLGLTRETGRIWFNGSEVNRFDLLYRPSLVASIPGNLVRPGVNTIVVRLTDLGGRGGMYGEQNALQLSVVGSDANVRPINIVGTWLMKQGLAIGELTPRPALSAYWPNNPNMPTVLFNAMIHPLIRMPIKGVIWYQGESNTEAAYEYRRLFPALIQDWRNSWGLGDFPFLYAQIAGFGNFQPPATEPRESSWAELREAQLMTLSTLKTGMAVTIDIGEVEDIHPINKRDVGIRLGLAAQAVAYGKKLEYSGPLYKSMMIKDGRAYITFTHDKGLTAKGEVLTGFAIAGPDRKFAYAKAEIRGNEVVVWNDAVESPVAVRYGWDFAPECNLYNYADLPASPFRTDDWHGVTAPKRDAAP